MPICTHKRYDWLATVVSKSPENKAKNPLSGQTCGQRRKMGLFNPQSREEQAYYICCENARFQEILRENKRKSEVRLNLRFWSEWQDLNLRPLPPQAVNYWTFGHYTQRVEALSSLFDLKFVHAIRKRSASKMIQKPICVAPCVANEDGLRGRRREEN